MDIWRNAVYSPAATLKIVRWAMAPYAMQSDRLDGINCTLDNNEASDCPFCSRSSVGRPTQLPTDCRTWRNRLLRIRNAEHVIRSSKMIVVVVLGRSAISLHPFRGHLGNFGRNDRHPNWTHHCHVDRAVLLFDRVHRVPIWHPSNHRWLPLDRWIPFLLPFSGNRHTQHSHPIWSYWWHPGNRVRTLSTMEWLRWEHLWDLVSPKRLTVMYRMNMDSNYKLNNFFSKLL